MFERDTNYVVSQLATWQSGACAVPLSTSSTRTELEYFIQDSQPEVVLCDPKYIELLQNLGTQVVPLTSEVVDLVSESAIKGQRTSHNFIEDTTDALIVYTSGTTGKPKGVVHTHKSLLAQIEALNAAWQWSSKDKILNVLPMHHIHGILNILNCSLYAGADCHMYTPRF